MEQTKDMGNADIAVISKLYHAHITVCITDMSWCVSHTCHSVYHRHVKVCIEDVSKQHQSPQEQPALAADYTDHHVLPTPVVFADHRHIHTTEQ